MTWQEINIVSENFVAFSVSIDASTDVADIQLPVFIRAVNEDF